jgi:hypothetical protein
MSKSAEIESGDIALGPLCNVSPIKVAFSSLNKDLVTWLYPDKNGTRQVHKATLPRPVTSQQEGISRSYMEQLLPDASGTAEKLSLAEQLRRERMRMFVNGVAHYQWSIYYPSNSTPSPSAGPITEFAMEFMLIPMGPRLVIYDRRTDSTVTLYDGHLGAAIDPQVSPTGNPNLNPNPNPNPNTNPNHQPYFRTICCFLHQERYVHL